MYIDGVCLVVRGACVAVRNSGQSAEETPWQCRDAGPASQRFVARSLLFFVVDSVCLSIICLSVTNIDSSFLFLGGIEPFLGHQFSMAKTTKRCSSMFDLGP